MTVMAIIRASERASDPFHSLITSCNAVGDDAGSGGVSGSRSFTPAPMTVELGQFLRRHLQIWFGPAEQK